MLYWIFSTWIPQKIIRISLSTFVMKPGSNSEQRKEQERLRLLEKRSNTPALNPFYRGKTPKDVARILFQAKPTKRSSK